MNYIISILTGYIIGSFPTAYILLKKHKGIDITQNGSGNVGALNSFEVSNSKFIGIAVLLIDLLKGLLSVLLVQQFTGNSFTYMMICLVFAVFSHSFSPWINFNGGRGLATAAGGMLVLSIPIIILWATLWLAAKAINRNVHIANVSATCITILLCVLFPEIINKLSSTPAQNSIEFSILVSIMFVVILVKHINPLIQLFNEQRKTSRIKYEQQQN